MLGGLEFSSLGSGSKGNCTIVRSASTTILIDCGFSKRKTVELLDRRNVQPEHIDAVLVTHEHSDHGRGVKRFCEAYGVPVYASLGTGNSLALSNGLFVRVRAGDEFTVGDVNVSATSVPHDTVEPLQFVFSNHGYRFGLLTDCGHTTPDMIEAYKGCNAVMLESNHDRTMLENGAYPPMLKRRVGGLYGHLSNAQSIDFLKSIMHEGLRTVVVGHISENNNDLGLVRSEFASFTDQCDIVLATQEQGTGWLR